MDNFRKYSQTSPSACSCFFVSFSLMTVSDHEIMESRLLTTFCPGYVFITRRTPEWIAVDAPFLTLVTPAWIAVDAPSLTLVTICVGVSWIAGIFFSRVARQFRARLSSLWTVWEAERNQYKVRDQQAFLINELKKIEAKKTASLCHIYVVSACAQPVVSIQYWALTTGLYLCA
jgi:hypothetical protein